jgi:hypothetical protein
LNVYSWNGGMKKPRSHREAPARGMAPSRKWNPSQGSHSAGQRWTVPELFPDCRLVSWALAVLWRAGSVDVCSKAIDNRMSCFRLPWESETAHDSNMYPAACELTQCLLEAILTKVH